MSYSELLVPSRSFFCKPRRQQSEHIELGDPTERCIHPGVARCFSYEPATHKATAHYVPHSPHGHYDKGTARMDILQVETTLGLTVLWCLNVALLNLIFRNISVSVMWQLLVECYVVSPF